jgi:hypothetical protein
LPRSSEGPQELATPRSTGLGDSKGGLSSPEITSVQKASDPGQQEGASIKQKQEGQARGARNTEESDTRVILTLEEQKDTKINQTRQHEDRSTNTPRHNQGCLNNRVICSAHVLEI